jgi:hypothetical protein
MLYEKYRLRLTVSNWSTRIGLTNFMFADGDSQCSNSVEYSPAAAAVTALLLVVIAAAVTLLLLVVIAAVTLLLLVVIAAVTNSTTACSNSSSSSNSSLPLRVSGFDPLVTPCWICGG